MLFLSPRALPSTTTTNSKLSAIKRYRYPTKLAKLPFGFYFKPPDIITFDLKSTTQELFGHANDQDDKATDSLIYLDECHDSCIQTSGAKKRKLRFDESSVIETSVCGQRKRKSIEKRGKFNNLSDVVIDDEELARFVEYEQA